MARPTGRPVRDELITEATRLVKSVGVTAFSYGDLAKQLGIKAPSIHHHFRVKEDLITAVAERYRLDFNALVAAIPEGLASDRLQAYADLFATTARSEQLCLCGAVAAEWLSIGEGPRAEVERFFADQLDWLTDEVAAGAASGEFRADLDSRHVASLVLAALEGSMLMCRAGASPDLAADLGALLLTMVGPDAE